MRYIKISIVLLAVFFLLPGSAQEDVIQLERISETLDRIESGVAEIAGNGSIASAKETLESEVENAAASEAPGMDSELRADTDGMFVLLCAALVFFMQAGFCLLELGQYVQKTA